MYFIVTCEVDLEHFTWARLTLLNPDATIASFPPLTTCGWFFFDGFFRSGFSHLVYGLVFLSPCWLLEVVVVQVLPHFAPLRWFLNFGMPS